MIRTVLILGSLLLALSAQAEIRRFAAVSEGVYRGAQPETAEDYDDLQALGVRTILNLRGTGSAVAREKALWEKRGLNFRHVALPGFVVPSEKDIERALATLGDPKLQPVFVHCQLGKDRTGLVVGLHRVQHEGMDPEVAYAEMTEFGFNPWLIGLSMYYWAHVPAGRGGEPAYANAAAFQTP